MVICDVVATMLGRAREVTQAHHEKLAELYPSVVKPKIHYLKHSFDSIERLGVNLSCFGPERRHKGAKAVAVFSYNKAFGNVTNNADATRSQLRPCWKTLNLA